MYLWLLPVPQCWTVVFAHLHLLDTFLVSEIVSVFLYSHLCNRGLVQMDRHRVILVLVLVSAVAVAVVDRMRWYLLDLHHSMYTTHQHHC